MPPRTAIAQPRQTAETKTLAEQHVAECKVALLRADIALQLAVEADQTANAKILKMRALFAETERVPEIKPVSRPVISGSVIIGLYQFLQTGGLTVDQLQQVGWIIGCQKLVINTSAQAPHPTGTLAPPQGMPPLMTSRLLSQNGPACGILRANLPLPKGNSHLEGKGQLRPDIPGHFPCFQRCLQNSRP